MIVEETNSQDTDKESVTPSVDRASGPTDSGHRKARPGIPSRSGPCAERATGPSAIPLIGAEQGCRRRRRMPLVVTKKT